MLFNKNANGTEELRKHIPFLYASFKFDEIKTDIELAEEDLILVIGQEVYDKAKSHYLSNDFDPEGDAVLDKLVNHIQLPVALFAYHENLKTSDVSHEDTGRKVKIDSNNEKLPFEWMLDRDSAAMLRKAHKTTDRLLAFLDKNEEDTGWKETDSQALARSLFINTAKQFEEYYPIEESRRFFIKVLPFIKDIERKDLKPILGRLTFDDLKAKIKSNDLSEDDKTLLVYIREALVLKTMAKATQRFAISVIPEGVFQNYISERLTTQGKIPATQQIRQEVSGVLNDDAKLRFADLQEYLLKQEDPDTYLEEPISILPSNDAGKNYFRT